MITAEEIRKITEEKLEGTPHFVTEAEISAAGKISLYMDSFEKITVQDCVNVHRHLKANFGEDLEAYELSVSSAGMDRPFKDSRQYHKNIGRELQVLQKDGVTVKGVLKELQPDFLVIAESPKEGKKGTKPKKNTEEKLVNINFDQIKETKRIINFK